MTPYITIGGRGSRLKKISPKDKHLLYWKNKRIIEWILEIIPDAKIIGKNKTNNRVETLNQINGPRKDILIIDCDIIPFGFDKSNIDTSSNAVFVFESNKQKYGSVLIENNIITNYSESDSISRIKCSGIYFIKDLDTTISKMTNKNSIISGMVGASTVHENTFVRLGDIEDYMEAIGIRC